jgi:type II secretory pathway pseudopilin PulG
VLLPLDNARRDKRPPAARGSEAGYALTELLIVATLLVIVLGAILTLGETSQRIAPKESERALVIREAQVGLHRMTRELRHAYQTPTVTGSTIEATVPNGTSGQTIRYVCNVAHPSNAAYTRCLRYVVVGGVPGAGQLVIDRVLNGSAVFALHGTNYVTALVEVAAKGDLQNGYDHKVVLDDGFYMRNISG